METALAAIGICCMVILCLLFSISLKLDAILKHINKQENSDIK